MKRIELYEIARILKGEDVLLLKYQNKLAVCCDARNDRSVKILKELTGGDFVALLSSNKTPFNRYVHEMPSVAWDIIDTSTDPLILLLPHGTGVSKYLLDENGNIAIRLSNCPFEIDLINKSKCPLAFCFLKGNKPDRIEKIACVYDISSLKCTDKAEPVIFLSQNNEVEVIRQ